MQTIVTNESVQLTLPNADLSFLRTISKKMGWSLKLQRKAARKREPSSSLEMAESEQARPKVKSGIEKGLEDIRKGNVFHAKDSDDLIKQILG